MTPYEVAKHIHKELSPIVPKLSAALNRALTDIGEGSILVGIGNGYNQNDPVSFQETEQIDLKSGDAVDIIAKISEMMTLLEQKTSWRVIIDKKPGSESQNMEFLYTIYREKRSF